MRSRKRKPIVFAIQIAGIIALFSGCVAYTIVVYPREDSGVMLLMYILPVFGCAAMWGMPAGLLAGFASTAMVTAAAAFIHPAMLWEVVPVAVFFYVGNGFLVGRFFDLTRRIRLQNARLAASEERYRTLFDGVPIGLYRTTPSGKIVDINMAMCLMLAAPDRQALLAMNATDLYVNPGQRDEFRRLIERDSVVIDFEVRLRRFDGSEVIALLSTRLVRDEAEKPLYFEGSVRNVTELRRMEQDQARAEAQRQRLERLESVGFLAAGVAHAINNICAGLRGYGEFLSRGVERDPRVSETGVKIAAATDRIVRVIDGLLATLGAHMFNPRPTSLAEIVQEAIRTSSLSAAPIDLDLKEAGEAPPVEADPDRMAEGLAEIIKNAVEASAADGRILIRADRGPLDPATIYAPPREAAATFARISVTDRGRGMDAAMLDRLFEPYFTTKEFGKGSGLGMVRVLGIVRQHGGTIGVESSPGQGTTVVLYLPVAGGKPR